MKKTPEQEPELRLLLEDYSAVRSGSTDGASRESFASAEPYFLLEDAEEKPQRWLAENVDRVETPDDTPLRLLIEDFQPAKRFFERNQGAPRGPAPEPGPEPNFVIDWGIDPVDAKRTFKARAGSFALHLALIIVAVLQPHMPVTPQPTEPDPGREYTKISLTAPSPEMLEQITQSARGDTGEAPNQTVASAPDPVIAPEVTLQPTPAPRMQPVIPVEEVEQETVAIIEEPDPAAAPEPAAARSPEPGEFQRGTEIASNRPDPPAVTRAPPQEQPKLQLENARAIMPAPDGLTQLGELKLTRGRDQMIESAIAQRSDFGTGRQAVGDGVGAAAIGGYAAPSRGNIGSGLELLSDPEGVDFRPYLLQILNSVRRNWFAVIPESARLGVERGRVALQFSISREGDVPKLVISSSSRSQPLDRASVAGVSASLPLPPLPAEFKGDEIRVQFVFLYNTKE